MNYYLFENLIMIRNDDDLKESSPKILWLQPINVLSSRVEFRVVDSFISGLPLKDCLIFCSRFIQRFEEVCRKNIF